MLWNHRTHPALSDFEWQAGYGAFTVSASQKKTVYQYVQKQELYHAKYTFQAEYLGLLKAHDVEYDAQNIWD